MTNHANPTEQPAGKTPSWEWLQDRLDQNAVADLDHWFESKLDDLEQLYAEYVTPKSRKRALHQSLSRERE